VRGVFEGIAAPAIQAAVVLSANGVSAGALVRLVGTGLGRTTASMAAVFIGSVMTSDFALTDRLSGFLEVTLPPGVGSVPVTVRSAAGLTSSAASAPLLQYNAPTVTRCSPSALLAGPTPQNLVIEGTGLALVDSDIDSVTIGGTVCPSARVGDVPGSTIVCEGIVATEDWSNAGDGVRVTVGGQVSALVEVSIFQAVPLPEVTAASPRTVAPGTQVSVLGRFFGSSSQDLARVELGGTHGVLNCASWFWRSESEVSCTVPSNHPLWASPEPAEGAPAEELLVRVLNTAGGQSPWLALVADGRSQELGPVVLPRSIDGARDVGQFDRLTIRWLYPRQEAERRLTVALVGAVTANLIAGATFFSVEVADALNETTSVPGTEGVSVFEANPLPAASFRAGGPWWDEAEMAVFEAQVRVPRATAVLVRVRASSANGNGPWSVPSAPIWESCGSDAFLDTRGGVASVRCRPCPQEATCAGLTDANIYARPGFWRVPWAPLAFMPCRAAAACKGVDEPPILSGRNESFPAGKLLLPRQAVPGAELDPARLEGCTQGHAGVQCTACEDGWFPSGLGGCSECGDPGSTAAQMAGVAILVVIAVTAFLFYSSKPVAGPVANVAHRSASFKVDNPMTATTGTASSPVAAASSRGERVPSDTIGPTLLMKIVLTHLQTVGIVAGVQLEWPQAVGAYFAAANAGSGLSTESLALPCVFGPLGAVARSGLVVAAAVCLAVYAMALWAVIVGCRGAKARTTARSPCQAFGASWWSRAGPSLLVLGFVLHASVSEAVLELLACTRIAPTSAAHAIESDQAVASTLWQSRLVAELDIRCDDNASTAVRLALAVPVLVLFSLGLPIGATLALRFRQSRLRTDPGVIRTWGFLYEGFRVEAGAAWWESIIMMRKLLLAVVTVILAPSGPVVQSAAALMVVMAALGLHAWVKPYESRGLNALEALGLIVAVATLCAAQLLDAGASGVDGVASTRRDTRLGLTFVILASNACFFIVAALLAFRTARRMLGGFCDGFARSCTSDLGASSRPRIDPEHIAGLGPAKRSVQRILSLGSLGSNNRSRSRQGGSIGKDDIIGVSGGRKAGEE